MTTADKIRAAVALLTEIANELDPPKTQGQLVLDLADFASTPDPEADNRITETRKRLERNRLGGEPKPGELR